MVRIALPIFSKLNRSKGSDIRCNGTTTENQKKGSVLLPPKADLSESEADILDLRDITSTELTIKAAERFNLDSNPTQETNYSNGDDDNNNNNNNNKDEENKHDDRNNQNDNKEERDDVDNGNASVGTADNNEASEPKCVRRSSLLQHRRHWDYSMSGEFQLSTTDQQDASVKSQKNILDWIAA